MNISKVYKREKKKKKKKLWGLNFAEKNDKKRREKTRV